MDPNELQLATGAVVGALSTGAAQGFAQLSKEAVVGGSNAARRRAVRAWQRLRDVVYSRLPGDEIVLERFEENPTVDAATSLEALLLERGVAGNTDVQDALREFLDVAGPVSFGPDSLSAGAMQQFNDRGSVGIQGSHHGPITAGYSGGPSEARQNPSRPGRMS